MNKANTDAVIERMEGRTLMSGAPVVADPNFATPSETDSFAYNPTGTPWSYVARSGIAVYNGYESYLPKPPVGTQGGFLQNAGATISQAISGFTAGSRYTLTYYEAGRSFGGGANPYEVIIDNQVVVAKRVAPSNTAFDEMSVTFSTSTAGSHTLSFEGFGVSGADVSTFIDDVQVTPVVASSISGTVFSDPNVNGKQDTGEKGLANVRVYIDANKTGSYTASDVSVLTSSTGTFAFPGLSAGTYRIREVLPAGDISTTPTAGYFDVTITSANVTGLVFGDAPATAKITGTVFVDFNSDGKIDGNDFGLALFTVDLTYTSGIYKGKAVTTTTAANGTFSFTGLTAGTYTVKVVPPVTGVTPTKPNANTLNLTLTATAVSAGNLFGEL
jgi:uncharacterized protein (DUF2141 family)